MFACVGFFTITVTPLSKDHFVAPVKLVGFPGCKAQWHIGRDGRGATLLAPAPHIPTNRIVAPDIAQTAKLFDNRISVSRSRAALLSFATSNRSSSAFQEPIFG